MPVDLSPHPFVATVAYQLETSKELDGPLAPAAQAYDDLETNEDRPEEPEAGEPSLTGNIPEARTPSRAELRSARLLAGAPNLPRLVTFSGYLGATFKRARGEEPDDWTVLYLDSRLWTWLLVQSDGIVYRLPVKDDASPFGSRDVIWVKETATVGRGSDALSIESQFLTGNFTSAGDSETPPGAGTPSAATGVFCEARSPGCCRKTPG